MNCNISQGKHAFQFIYVSSEISHYSSKAKLVFPIFTKTVQQNIGYMSKVIKYFKMIYDFNLTQFPRLLSKHYEKCEISKTS